MFLILAILKFSTADSIMNKKGDLNIGISDSLNPCNSLLFEISCHAKYKSTSGLNSEEEQRYLLFTNDS